VGEPASRSALGLLPDHGAWLRGAGEYRSYVENSIVDASIFLVVDGTFGCRVRSRKTMFVIRSFLKGRDDNHWSSLLRRWFLSGKRVVVGAIHLMYVCQV
jgi:hypothetical protein